MTQRVIGHGICYCLLRAGAEYQPGTISRRSAGADIFRDHQLALVRHGNFQGPLAVIRRDGDDEGARGREAAEPLAERRKLRAADDRVKGATDQSRRG